MQSTRINNQLAGVGEGRQTQRQRKQEHLPREHCWVFFWVFAKLKTLALVEQQYSLNNGGPLSSGPH